MKNTEQPSEQKLPSKEECVQSAMRLIEQRILSKGGKLPDEDVVRGVAKLIGLKAHKEMSQKV